MQKLHQIQKLEVYLEKLELFSLYETLAQGTEQLFAHILRDVRNWKAMA